LFRARSKPESITTKSMSAVKDLYAGVYRAAHSVVNAVCGVSSLLYVDIFPIIVHSKDVVHVLSIFLTALVINENGRLTPDGKNVGVRLQVVWAMRG